MLPKRSSHQFLRVGAAVLVKFKECGEAAPPNDIPYDDLFPHQWVPCGNKFLKAKDKR
jgi:hypothetical protein